MQQCESCGEREASIHLTQVEQNEMRTIHLCDACASEQGLESGMQGGSAMLADFLAEMGKGASSAQSAGACSFCATTLRDLKRTGRLGCPDCYTEFDQHLRGILRKLHGSTQHTGKMYTADAEEIDRAAHLAGLRRRLEIAVEGEDFEQAVALRDQIRRLEQTPSDG